MPGFFLSPTRLFRPLTTLCLLAGLVAAGCGEPADGAADLVMTGGKIVTLSDAMPEASALAARDGRIVAVGNDDDVAGLIGPETQVIDLAGRLAIPGFIEGHGHFMGLGNAKMILDLTTAGTWDDIVSMVGEAASSVPPGEWISGRGWHQEKWSEVPEGAVEGQPTHQTLTAVSQDNPVILTHASGHAAFANGMAMELAAIDADTPDPDGGTIVRDSDGEATGVLRETAQGLVRRVQSQAMAARGEEEIEREARLQVRLAGQDLLSKGITSFQDAGSGLGTVDLLRSVADQGQLPVRMYVMLSGGPETLADRLPEYYMVGYADNWLTVRSIKQVVDGALGSHGAWLLEPYTDMPSSVGLATNPPQRIEAVADLALEHGYQLATHAIGDRGNREVLDLYERAFAAAAGAGGSSADVGAGVRWRIEHAQHLDPEDIPRFGQLGVIASMQGIHNCSDAPWIPIRLGDERARTGAYVWRDLMNTGALVTNGTDTPVEDADPLASFHCSVTRLTNTGDPFHVEQAMTREEALRSYTISNAYAAFEEHIKGTLEVGKLADITVLSRDIMTIPAEEILDTEVDYTIIGGSVAYSRN